MKDTTTTESSNNNNDGASPTCSFQTTATVQETLSFVYRCGWKTRLLFVGGTIGGIAHGLALPSVAYFMSRTFEDLSQISTTTISTNSSNNGTTTTTTADSSSSSDYYDESMATIRDISFTFLALGFYSLVSAFLQTACFEQLAYHAARLFQTEWFTALLRQDAAFFDLHAIQHQQQQQSRGKSKNKKKASSTPTTGTTISPESIVQYQQGIGRKLGELIQHGTTGLAGVALGFYSSWKVSLLVFAIIPLIAFASLQVIRLNQGKTARSSEAYARAGGIAYRTLSSLRTMLSLNAIPRRIEHYQDATKKAFDSATKILIPMGLWSGSIMSAVICLFMGVILFGSFVMYGDVRSTGCNPAGGGNDVDACDNTGAEIFRAMMGILFAGQSLSLIGNSLECFAQARVATLEALRVISRTEGSCSQTFYKQATQKSEDISTPLDTTPDSSLRIANEFEKQETGSAISAKDNVVAILPEYKINPFSDTGIKPQSVQGELKFDNVTFAYPARPTVPILKNFSMIIPAGKTVALVGPSGGGKSTVLSLIERFYDPLEGQVCLDGTDVQSLNLSHYRGLLGYVGQEPSLFATTIRDNIACGARQQQNTREPVTQEAIEKAAKLANAHDDFIIGLPDGYDTQVGDTCQLSGGQKQRIAIARTLMAQPKILCLDEATSALDAESELFVQHALDDILEQGSMTAVIVAHRLSTIRKADLIYVISGGGVVEAGSHEELMASETGHYRKLVETQEGSQKDSKTTVLEATPLKTLDNQKSFEDLLTVEIEASASLMQDTTPLLEFRGVEFSYPSRPDKRIMKKFNLSVMRGETLALVGPSGGGKSTTVGLIERYYDPSAGVVEYKGHDIKTLNTNWYRDQIGYVGQEPTLFPGTIAENIAFGVTDATQAMIEEAALQANIHEFVMSLPDAYSTQVGESGAQLSGGQKQRVAIARALIKKPPVLLLDEATSALDSKSEAVVQEALAKLMRSPNQTVIVIAHKLATVRDAADRIAVVGNGEVLEIGNHRELLAKNGHYKRLVRAQQRGTSLHSLGLLKSESSVSGAGSKSSVDSDIDGKDSKEEESIDEEHMKTLTQRIKRMATPDVLYIAMGSIGAIMSGASYPILGVLFAETINLFFYTVAPCTGEVTSLALGFDSCSEYWNDAADEMQSKSFEMSVFYSLLVIDALIGSALLFWGFGIASERLSKRVRDNVFTALVRQEVGFFDRQNIGDIKTRLQESTARLQAFSGAPVRTLLLAISSLLIGLVVSFFVMWPYALLCIACMVPVGYAMKLRAKATEGRDEGNEADANASAGAIMVETLLHMKTVSALGLERQKIKEFEAAIEKSQVDAGRMSAIAGFTSGIGMFLQRCSNAVLYFWGGYLLLNYPEHYEFSDFLIAQLSFIFGTLGLGAALQDIDDRTEVEASARWIFSILDRKSQIDPLSGEGKKLD